MAEQSRTQNDRSVERNRKPTTGRLGTPEQTHPALVLKRAQAAPTTLTHADVMTLQRTIGNRATGQLLQAKLKLGPAGDRYEQEADRVARQVVHTSRQPAVQREEGEEHTLQASRYADSIADYQRSATPVAAGISRVQRVFTAQPHMAPVQRDDLEEDELQAKPNHGLEGGDVDNDVARSIESAKGSGQPLDDSVRGKMEQGFGASFGRVRIHTGGQADALNRSLNARAFTTGNDIFFGKGQYNPGSSGGQELIAHELTHTVQQGGADVKPKSSVSGDVGQRQIDAASLSKGKNNLVQRLAYDDAPSTWNPTKVSRSGDGAAGVYFVKENTDMVVLKPMSGSEASGTELSNEIMEKAVGLEAPQTVSYKKTSGEGQILSSLLLTRAQTIEEESGRPPGQVKSQVDGSSWFMVMSAVKGKSINRLGDEGAKQFVEDAGAMKGIGKIIAGDAFLGNGDRITMTLNLGNFFYDTEDSTVRTIDNDMNVESSSVAFSARKKKKVVKGGADSRTSQMESLMDPTTRDGLLKYYFGKFRDKFVSYGWDEAVDAMDEEFFITNVGKGVEEGFASMAKAFTDNIDLVRATAIDKKYGTSVKRDKTTLKGTAQYLSARVGGDTQEEAQEKLRKYVEYRAARAKKSTGLKWWTKLTSKTGF